MSELHTESATMRAVTFRWYGPPDVLQVETLPVPAPRDCEVLVRVGAVAVSAADAAMRAADPFIARFASGMRRPRRTVLGTELAGEIVAVGAGVTGRTVGERVAGATGIEMGGYAEYVSLPAEGVALIPDGIGLADAVAIVEGGLTALPFLRDHAKVRPGQHVLINGASGGVGTAAVQLAKTLGAVVTGVCSAANAELVAALGADQVIDYAAVDFTRNLGAYDVVLDTVGKGSFRRCRRALKPGGIYLTTVPSAAILVQMLGTRWIGSRRAGIAFTWLRKPIAKAQDVAFLLELAGTGAIRPVIDRALPLADVVEAHRYVDTWRKRGAVVLTP